MTAQPKNTAPIQPRIISMPQSEPQLYKSPQSPPHVMGMSHTHDNIQLRPQPHIQPQHQWRQIMPDGGVQSYHEAPNQGFMATHIPTHISTQVQFQSQSHPQSHGVTQTQVCPQQWAPLRGGIETQTYSSVQVLGQLQTYPQPQGFPSPQPQGLPSPQPQGLPSPQPQGLPSPQPQGLPSPQPQGLPSPQPQGLPSPQPQGLRSPQPQGLRSPQPQGLRSPQPQGLPSPQPQGLPSPQPQGFPSPQSQGFPSPQSQGLPSPQSQGLPSPQPQGQPGTQFSSQSPGQPYSQLSHQSPAQSVLPLQHWQPGRQSDMVRQSYPQIQMSEYPQVQWSMQPEPQSQVQFMKIVPQTMSYTPWAQPPSQAPVRPQRPASQQPQTQQQSWPQNRPEAPFQVQFQSQSLQSKPQVQVLQKPQLPEQEQPQQKALTQAKLVALAPVRPPAPAPHQPQTQYQQWSHNRTEALFQVQIPSQTLQMPSQVQVLQKPQSQVQEERQQHLAAQVKPPAQDQAPPQAYSEAEALAKNNYEDAKRCLQEHILEAISIFNDKKAIQKQESFNLELLKEFLKAKQGMEGFCTSSQLQDLELFTQSVRTEWEACFSASSSLVSAEQQLEALKQLCATLSPEDANRLAQVQPGESETTLPAIQCPSSEDQDMTPTGSGADNTDISAETCSSTETRGNHYRAQRPKTVEKKAILKQISTEEDRYRSSRFELQAQLNRNEQSMLGDRPSGSVSATDLQKRLRELKALQDETECLWSEYETQCSQCSQVNERAVEQDRAELTVKYREQRAQLQRRSLWKYCSYTGFWAIYFIMV
ncbi:uncharacterized protein Hap1MRO34_010303 [Clarias gariepinus]